MSSEVGADAVLESEFLVDDHVASVPLAAS